MSRTWIKIMMPVIGVFFCIAFLEINFPGIQQTWNDPYDVYLAVQQNPDIHEAGIFSVDTHIQPAFLIELTVAIPLLLFAFSLILIGSSPPLLLFRRSYLRNCVLRL